MPVDRPATHGVLPIRLPSRPVMTGGRTAAVLYAVVLTCKPLGIDPFAYLRETLMGLFALGEKPTAEQLAEWLPDRWLGRRAREGPGEAATG
ncbi:MAG: hypothetical protein U0736_20730 [Gemmataceae bacterium]